MEIADAAVAEVTGDAGVSVADAPGDAVDPSPGALATLPTLLGTTTLTTLMGPRIVVLDLATGALQVRCGADAVKAAQLWQQVQLLQGPGPMCQLGRQPGFVVCGYANQSGIGPVRLILIFRAVGPKLVAVLVDLSGSNADTNFGKIPEVYDRIARSDCP